ncbi:LysR family transcriptional regulator [Marinilactibacillus sp. GCM10026970]|uniref:LysR substrate-binding domain-containing protein n=1 Tax=Marinilactibacillus sp. GCM10026970 TaxID=3252642 RepID=UPI003618CEEB
MLDKRVLYFIGIVEEGSFSAAGKAHLITQSAISQQIAFLESDLSVQLFDRSFYKPKLTKAGELFYTFWKETLEREADMILDLQTVSRIEGQMIHIGITGPLESKHLPSIIAFHEERFPEKIIKVTKGNFKSCMRQLETGELDAVFGRLDELSAQSTIEVTPLIRSDICILCSPNHPLGKQETVALEELGNYPIVSLSQKAGPDYFTEFKQIIREKKIELKTVSYVDSIDELTLAIQLNKGISWAGKKVLEKTDKFKAVDLETTYFSAVCGIGKRKRNQREDVQKFIELCETYFKNEYASI